MNTMRINDLILTDIFPNWLSGGIFKELTNNHNVPWKDSISDGSILDLEYYGNRSGNKIVAPLMYNLLDTKTGEVKSENVTKLAAIIFYKYGTNWSQLAETLKASYNPIENYNMVEEEEGDFSSESGSDTTRTGNVTNTKSGNMTQDNTKTGSTKTTNDMYAFNSTAAVPTSDTTQTILGDGAEDNTKTTYNNLTDTQSYNSVNDNVTGTASGDNHRKLTRSGNIGVTTSAQMLEGHNTFWGDWSFFEQVFADVDEVLTIPTFGEGCTNWVEIVKSHVPVYVLPKAGNELGGVKANDKLPAMTSPVCIDENGYLWTYAAGGEGAVLSVNGKTGAVVLNAADVSALPSDTVIPTMLSQLTGDSTHRVVTDAQISQWNEGGTGAVESVNGKTGVVVLNAADMALSSISGMSARNVQEGIEEVNSKVDALSDFTYTERIVGKYLNQKNIYQTDGAIDSASMTSGTPKAILTVQGAIAFVEINGVIKIGSYWYPLTYSDGTSHIQSYAQGDTVYVRQNIASGNHAIKLSTKYLKD